MLLTLNAREEVMNINEFPQQLFPDAFPRKSSYDGTPFFGSLTAVAFFFIQDSDYHGKY